MSDGQTPADERGDDTPPQKREGDDQPAAGDGPGDPGGDITRCDYCRLPIPGEAVTREYEGVVYEFCSTTCREAIDQGDRVFTQYHGFRRLRTGVSALDGSLPQGIPRNSFVLLADLAGTRTEAVQAELVWRALQRGEPVVYVSFLEPPVSLVQEFVTLEWNVLPSLEAGDLRILDCFSYRVDDRERMYERMDAWNTHLWEVAEESTTKVRDPTNIGRIQNRLDSALEAIDAQDEGIVVIDSLTELGSLVQPVQAYNFLKDVRADICKGRFVPVFAGATVTGDDDAFPHDLGYMVDGIIEMRLNDDLIDGALVKQFRVRKMSGVLTFPEWQVYEYTSGQGLVTFDPVAQQAAAEEETESDADAPPDDAEPAPDSDEAAPDEGSGT